MMADNISKALYLGFGVLLLVLALTSFYNNNQSFINYNKIYENSKVDHHSWMKEATNETKNPLGIVISDISLVKDGLVFSGRETKAQLLGLYNESLGFTIYKEGVLVLESDYTFLYNSIVESDQLLITYDEKLKAVYIVTL